MRIIELVKKEIVLVISWVLAIISMLFVPIDTTYISYIDWRTISLLFCLMVVVAGFGKSGVFTFTGNSLLKYFKGTRGIVLVLVLLCFFFSMLITNDVALITFVPFAVVVLKLSNSEKYVVPTLVLQTVAANLGSMLTPVGNPQNLYLYGKAGLSAVEFMGVMLPYTVASAVLLVACVLFIKNTKPPFEPAEAKVDVKSVVFWSVLFVICFLAVAEIVDYKVILVITLVAVMIKDRRLFKNVDYSLLLTFCGFFVFIGNMGRIQSFNSFVSSVVAGNEMVVSLLSSQVISNVPTALLLSGFSHNWRELIIGTNLGGLGTLIASMASLISYKQLATEYPELKGRYVLIFTGVNLLFMLVLVGLYFVL